MVGMIDPAIRKRLSDSEYGRFTEALTRVGALGADSGVRSARYVTGRHRAFVFEIVAEPSGQIYFLKLAAEQYPDNFPYLAQEAKNTSRVFEALGRDNNLRSVEPIAYFSELHCLVIAGSPGERLDRIILQAGKRIGSRRAFSIAEEYCVLAAQWLAAFQKAVELPGTEEGLSRQTFVARAERELVSLNLGDPGRFGETFCRRVRTRLLTLLDSFQDADFVSKARHNDFAPWNMLCLDDGICVFDYADLKGGARCEDAQQFLDAMSVLSNRFPISKDKIRRLTEVFLDHCEPVRKTSDAASSYFSLLSKLVRAGAVLKNSSTSGVARLRHPFLLDRYERELRCELSL